MTLHLISSQALQIVWPRSRVEDDLVVERESGLAKFCATIFGRFEVFKHEECRAFSFNRDDDVVQPS